MKRRIGDPALQRTRTKVVLWFMNSRTGHQKQVAAGTEVECDYNGSWAYLWLLDDGNYRACAEFEQFEHEA